MNQSLADFLTPRMAPVALIAALLTSPLALAEDSTLHQEARAAVTAWMTAVQSGDPKTLDPVLAPEFQILRSDGRGFAKADYLAGGMAQIREVQDITDLTATRQGDVMVVRYRLTVQGTVAGQPLEPTGPRLTVFRRDGDRWRVVAHANFARIAQ